MYVVYIITENSIKFEIKAEFNCSIINIKSKAKLMAHRHVRERERHVRERGTLYRAVKQMHIESIFKFR